MKNNLSLRSTAKPEFYPPTGPILDLALPQTRDPAYIQRAGARVGYGDKRTSK